MASWKPWSHSVSFLSKGLHKRELAKDKTLHTVIGDLGILLWEFLNNVKDDILQKVICSTTACLRKLVKPVVLTLKYDCLVSFAHLESFFCAIKFSL